MCEAVVAPEQESISPRARSRLIHHGIDEHEHGVAELIVNK